MLRRMWAAAAVAAGVALGGPAGAADDAVKLGRYQPAAGGFAGAVKAAGPVEAQTQAGDTVLTHGGHGGGGHGGFGGGHYGGGHYGGFGGYHGGYGGGYRGYYGGGYGYRGFGYGGYGYRGYGYGGFYRPYYGFGYGGFYPYYGGFGYGFGSGLGYGLGYGLGSSLFYRPYYGYGYGGYGGGYYGGGYGGYGGGYGGYYSANYYTSPVYYASGTTVVTPSYSYCSDGYVTVNGTTAAKTVTLASPAARVAGPFRYDGGPANPAPRPAVDKPSDRPADVDTVQISLPAKPVAAKPVHKYLAYGEK